VDRYSRRGLRYSDNGDFKHAIGDFTRVISLAPKNADAYSNRCWARLVADDQLQNAISDCSESLRIRPDDAETLNNRGLLYLKTNKLDEAIADFTAAIKLNANFASAIFGRGLAKSKSDSVGAQGDMATATELDPDIAQELARYGVE
jgi:tetratricopeptide (TPR) repeat protein